MIVDQLFTSPAEPSTRQIFTESRHTYNLWESAGQKIVEAQLTADQINQIFQQVEQGATAAGGNRTLIGRGKDAAGAVGRAWEDLKTKAQNSGPIKNVDAMYDKAAEQLKQATGGDQGVMQYVQKYRDFAKKYPVAQSLIYSALIAAAGISGAGVAGAAALGLFKLVDKLLQGEKFSSAAYSGVKTGAMAYGASQIGDYIKGQSQAPAVQGSVSSDEFTGTLGQGDPNLGIPAGGGNMVAPPGFGGGGGTSYEQAFKQGLAKLAANPGNPSANDIMRAKDYAGKVASGMLPLTKESVELTENQIFLMIGKIVDRQRKIDEGIMDTLKGAAGKAMDWTKTKGTNLTTKITADKLLQAWKKAGSPTDSLDVASIIQKAGVPSASIKQVYGTMKIPFAGEKGAGADVARKIDVDSLPVAPALNNPASGATPTNAPAKTGGAQRQAYAGTNPATGKPWTVDELQARMQPVLATAPEAPAGQSPEEIRKAKQATAAKAAQDQMAGGPTLQTPPVTPTPSALPQPTTAGQPKVTYGKGFEKFMQPKPTTQFPNFGTAGMAPAYKTATAPAAKTTVPTTTTLPAGGGTGVKAAAGFDPKTQAYLKSIQDKQPASLAETKQLERIAKALSRPVTSMLQVVETKEDVQRIKQFVDQTFAKYGTLTESAFGVRNIIVEHVTQVGAQRRREHARKSA